MKERFRVGAISISDNVFFVVGVEGVATGIALVDKILLRVLKVDMVRMQGYRGKWCEWGRGVINEVRDSQRRNWRGWCY